MRLIKIRSCWLGSQTWAVMTSSSRKQQIFFSTFDLTSAVDANRTLVSNIGRAIIKKLAVKFEGNEIMSMDDFNVLAYYRDLWKTKSEKRNAIHQGIISTDGCTENCIKLRINAGDTSTSNVQDKAIADAYGNKFIIPLDFEMLDSAAPYYQAGLGNRLL